MNLLGSPRQSNYHVLGTSILSARIVHRLSPDEWMPDTDAVHHPDYGSLQGTHPAESQRHHTRKRGLSDFVVATRARATTRRAYWFFWATCTLTQSGVYYLNNGLALALGASLRTAPGVHALIYIANGGTFSLLGTSMNITGMTTGDPYPGLAIWQAAADTNPWSSAANFSSDVNIDGVIYAAGAAVTNTIGGRPLTECQRDRRQDVLGLEQQRREDRHAATTAHRLGSAVACRRNPGPVLHNGPGRDHGCRWPSAVHLDRGGICRPVSASIPTPA